MDIKRIGVVYLCRANEKKEAYINFVNSYKMYSTKCIHELIVIFKGFQDHAKSYFNEVQNIFDGLNYKAIYLPDEGFDIGSYLATASIVDHNYLLFLNTHTTIVANDWLDHLYYVINRDGVGLVGATASYESIFSSNFLASRFSDFYFKRKLKNDPQVLNYYQWLLTAIDPNNDAFKRFRRYIKLTIKYLFKKNSNSNINKRLLYQKETYGEFPNPHIRSNGFMISRELLLNLFGDYKVKTKNDAFKFESGIESLTRRVWKLGMQALLVDKDGVAYDVKDWPKSNTFRLGAQENLLMNDNQTRNYDNFSDQEKLVHSWISWGNDIINSKDEVPRFGLSFDTTFLTNVFDCTKDLN